MVTVCCPTQHCGYGEDKHRLDSVFILPIATVLGGATHLITTWFICEAELRVPLTEWA